MSKNPTAWTNLSFVLYHTYHAEGRFYHDIRHPTECFGELERAKQDGIVIENEDAVRLAIWYHDFYQNHDGQDEEASAKQGYEAALTLGYDEDFAKIVHRLILVTKHSDLYPPVTPDEMLICDIDLVPLAADNFTERTEDVRQEYPDVPLDTFQTARRAILSGFLTRPGGLYRLPHFQALYGAKAAKNIEDYCSQIN